MRAAAAVGLTTVLAALAFAYAGGAQDQAEAVAESYDAENLRLVRFVGVLEIESGGDRITVDYDPGEGLIRTPEFDVEGDTLEITQLRRRTHVECRSRGDELRVEVADDGYNPIADYGTLRIRIPDGASVDIGGGAISGAIGDVGALKLGLGSCGDVVIGDVAGRADVALNGSGDVRIGSIGDKLSLAMNGGGDVVTGAVGDGVDVAINGAGDVEIASLTGDLHAAINGSGDIRVLAGEIDQLDASIMGSGDVRFGGVAGRVNLSAFGSGDVYVEDVTGPVRSSAFGSGRVHVGEN